MEKEDLHGIYYTCKCSNIYNGLTQFCIIQYKARKDYGKHDWKIVSIQKNTAFKKSQWKARRWRNSFKVSVPWTFLNSPHDPRIKAKAKLSGIGLD